MRWAANALLLLALLVGVQGQRKLLQDGCADLSVLASVPGLSYISTLIKDFDLLPSGIPADLTVFLPNDAGVDALVQSIQSIAPLPGLSVETLAETVAPLGSLVTDRLISALLYHIAPVGAQDAASLAAEETIKTALPDYTLTFAAGATPGSYVITDGSATPANVTAGPVAACGSSVYVVDKVLLPADLLAIPATTPEQAAAILAGLGGAAPAPAPAP